MRRFRRIGRTIGSVTLTLLAIAGAASVAVWGFTSAGMLQPLIVISGSMSPTIATGDLILGGRTAISDIAVGDVTSLYSPDHDVLVTHRVMEITETATGVEIRMKGDANNAVDAETYVLDYDDAAWQPIVVIPGGGFVATALMKPAVAAPIVLGILALCALALFPARGTTTTPTRATTTHPPVRQPDAPARDSSRTRRELRGATR